MIENKRDTLVLQLPFSPCFVGFVHQPTVAHWPEIYNVDVVEGRGRHTIDGIRILYRYQFYQFRALRVLPTPTRNQTEPQELL